MNRKFKVMVVDDEPDILALLQYNLIKIGIEVRTASNGKEALDIARAYKPDLILLDIMMPELDGVEACRAIREDLLLKDTIIIFLSSRAEEYSEVAAFEAGANDYIIKPIKPRALMSRISAYITRDIAAEKKDTTIKIKNLTIDKESFSVYIDNHKIALAKKEFELLYFLCQNCNKAFNREDLLKRVWGTDVFVVSRTVDVHVRKIREKIGDDYISTIKGIGYKFNTDE
jgi:two-component system, OmpR family, alkaline phosphatase synthesis response regulator PhoP